MKLSVLIILCVVSLSIAAAFPVQPESAPESRLAVVEPENQLEDADFGDELSHDDVDRVKRFFKWKHYPKYYPKIYHKPLLHSHA